MNKGICQILRLYSSGHELPEIVETLGFSEEYILEVLEKYPALYKEKIINKRKIEFEKILESFIKTEYENGKSFYKIGKVLNRTGARIGQIAQKLSLPTKKGAKRLVSEEEEHFVYSLWEEGKTQKEIAEETKLRFSQVSNIIYRFGRKSDRREAAKEARRKAKEVQAVALYLELESIREVAKVMQLQEKNVRDLLVESGIKLLGRRVKKNKLPEAMRNKIIDRIKSGKKNREIAKEFGIAPTTVGGIKIHFQRKQQEQEM